MLKINQMELGPVQTNCYIISNDAKECLIFDPGEEADKIIGFLQKKQLTPVAILLTHAHFDHIGAVDTLREKYEIPAYLHKLEKEWLGKPNLNGSGKYSMVPDYRLKDADILLDGEKQLEINGFKMDVFHTPGHSPGSVSYSFGQEGFAIVGDTLFRGSIGRTDLVDGSEKKLLQSINDSLLTLPEHMILYPGHGPETTPEQEKRSNPFLRG
ncbi:glyoxylase-like metal-dependent hydrolase (beta-lactamase superfamily II) [Planomicrobium koreense]|uniref:Glyoxylase-like metal-dependent hydrolase (Beta-lactamase superfamily II) n=1 Tax=Planococcus koreensis TaxID=112331 RepID=A0A7W8CVN5_9BACL|nr:MBL fold metallo-hydrolase [Planococcus koreensis]MBB5180860.1 glyoxylase-like metal-dependent hydrolase (beta-lactamase superfamily II) [Planococcus koreensis]